MNVSGCDKKIIYQGVHMILDETMGEPWGNEKRESTLVFIGRDLFQKQIIAALDDCKVK